MQFRFALRLAVGVVAIGYAGVAAAAGRDTDPLPAAATVDAVHSVMAEVFRPAPVPGDAHGPAERVAEAEAAPSLHPDVLSVRNGGLVSDGTSNIDYDRDQRMRPAGGMSLNIPMQ